MTADVCRRSVGTSVSLPARCLYSTWEEPQQVDFSGTTGGVHAEVDSVEDVGKG